MKKEFFKFDKNAKIRILPTNNERIYNKGIYFIHTEHDIEQNMISPNKNLIRDLVFVFMKMNYKLHLN